MSKAEIQKALEDFFGLPVALESDGRYHVRTRRRVSLFRFSAVQTVEGDESSYHVSGLGQSETVWPALSEALKKGPRQ